MANEGYAEAGTYRIVCASGSGTNPVGLDVSGGSLKDGASLQVYTPNLTAAQIFTISYPSSDAQGAARILNRLTGKCVDVRGGALRDGTAVQMYRSNDTNAQRWAIVADGGEATYNGAPYPTYTIRLTAASGLAMQASAATSGSAVLVKNASGTSALQRWVLVPIPAFASGGTYELRSMLKTSMAVDVAGASGVKGGNVQLYSANATNAQKFTITQEEGGWSIQNVNSRLYVDVAGGSARAGANVQQWTDNDTRAQRWNLEGYGYTTIDGLDCQVVYLGSYVTSGGKTYYMDVYNALTSNKANVDIQTASNSAKQRFALYPTTPKDADVPSVGSMGWVRAIGSTARQTTLPEAATLYPSWRTTKAWATDGPNHYEARWRSQSMDGRSGKWGSWSDWSGWATVPVRQTGTDVWMEDGLPATVGNDCRAIQYELMVRAVAVDSQGDMWTGASSTATLRAVQDATIAFESATFGPEGLYLTYSSDYDGGTNVLSVDSVAVGGKRLVSTPVLYPSIDAEGTILVESDALSGWIAEGATATVTYRNGTDMYPLHATSSTATLTVSYDGGTLALAPTVSQGEGRTVAVALGTGYDEVRAWLATDSGMVEMPVTGGTAYVTYPFGDATAYDVYLSATSGSAWGVAHVEASAIATALATANMTPCHAWNWSGGSFLLEVREGEPLATDYSVDRNYATFQLNEREWESVHYQVTKTGEFAAEGALSPLMDLESTRDDLFALLDAGYATYRSPSGLVADVAVTGFRIEESHQYATVSVSMVRVTN